MPSPAARPHLARISCRCGVLLARAVRTGCRFVEAGVPVTAAQAAMCISDLPAILARVCVCCGEHPRCYGGQFGSNLVAEMSTDLAEIGTSGTVGHIHHIPMLRTGLGAGETQLGRCSRIGPALQSGGKSIGDGPALRLT
jgi:hypothetical protein